MKRILIVDDDQDIARILRFRLQKKGFDCVLAANGLEALDKIDTHHPDLVLLDVMMPKMDGFTTCREIRKRNAWSRIPVIMLTAKGDTSDKVDGISEGADDYVVKPFEFEELLARIHMIMRRTQETMSANPLTGLPGNNVISKKIESAIAGKRDFAACYVDLDHFKAYNDEYGFEAGDKIIKRVAEIIVEVTRERAKSSFVGHVGGDDFLFLVDLNSFEECCEQVIQRFDAAILQYYRDEHVSRGYIECVSRQGQPVRFPIMSVSIGVVTNASRTFTDAMQVSNRAAEMKKFAKGLAGSVFKVDRRGSAGGAAPDGEEPMASARPGLAGEEGAKKGSGR
ncbi:MAG: response regulator [Candidatus Latescibacterota bacterium]|nr:MAG: response regulator [Candidatus Latescibacterota bacterium]